MAGANNANRQYPHPSQQSRTLQRVTLNVGQKMHEIKSTMRKNENHYERLTNAKSSQDLLLLQAAKQRQFA